MLRVLCPHCHQLHVLEHFELEANGVLSVRCSLCQCVTMVSAARSSSLSPTPAALASVGGVSNVVELRQAADLKRPLVAPTLSLDAPAGHCPKCIAKSFGRTTCGTCGLTFQMADKGQFLPSHSMAERWLALAGNWTSSDLHAALRDTAQSTGELPALARLYRIHLVSSAGDAMATEGLAALLAQAQLPLMLSTPSFDEPQRQRVKLVLAVLLFLGSIGFAWLTFRMLNPK